MQKVLTVLLLICNFSCFAQNWQRRVISKEDPFDLYANFDKDSNTLFYEMLVPRIKPTGVLVIMAGSGEMLEDVKKQISLDELAVKKGLLVIIPSINWGTNKGDAEHRFLDAIFKEVLSHYKVPEDQFVLGGFSGGAMLALTYAQKAARDPDSTFIRPKAVFGVDPPLDYAHLWNHCKKDIERNVSQAAVQEARWIMDSYIKEFGGSPEEHPESYIKYSIFSYSQQDGGNAKYLINTPVLLFTEPDIMWQMKNRQRDYYDLNCVDIAAMINLLQLKGNKEAQLVVTHQKGKRLNGMRHPHSWSIMDSQLCLNWIFKQLKN
jgi:hypothetical protein